MKLFKGDVNFPRAARGEIRLIENASQSTHDARGAFWGDVVADPHVHAFVPSDGHSWGYDALEIPYRRWSELREPQQQFMSCDFVFRRIAQDAFDPVALSDEVDESGVSSVKHRVARIL